MVHACRPNSRVGTLAASRRSLPAQRLWWLLVMCVAVLASPPDLFAQVTYDIVADLTTVGGAAPLGGVTRGADGALYGTTSLGGAENCGIVYRLDAAGRLSLIHEFSEPDGCRPMGELALGPDGSLYGVASQGGYANELLPAGSGTIYRIASDGTFTVLYRLPPPAVGDTYLAPFWPRAGLTLGPDDFFYGTLFSSDVFRISPDGAFALVRQFSAPDPQELEAAVVFGPDGYLYTTTQTHLLATTRADRGSVFRVSLAGDSEELRHFYFFTAPDGAPSSPEGGYPAGEVVVRPEGTLYGANRQYGPNAATDRGTIFRRDSDGTFTVLHAFSESLDHSYPDGATPVGGLIFGADGQIYGKTLAGGADGSGTIFSIDHDGVFTTLQSFPQDGYSQTKGRLFEPAPGVFYGTATSETGGVVYRVGPASLPTKARVKVLFPHPAARLAIGSTRTIRWIHRLGEGSAVRIDLSRDGGTTWETIAPSVQNATAHVGTFDWAVTGPATTDAVIRVTSLSTDTFDVSKSFRIVTHGSHGPHR